jgi:hypothetical protein
MVPGKAWRVPVYWPGGVRYVGGASLICGFCAERGKADADTGAPFIVKGAPRGRAAAAETVSR